MPCYDRTSKVRKNTSAGSSRTDSRVSKKLGPGTPRFARVKHLLYPETCNGEDCTTPLGHSSVCFVLKNCWVGENMDCCHTAFFSSHHLDVPLVKALLQPLFLRLVRGVLVSCVCTKPISTEAVVWISGLLVLLCFWCEPNPPETQPSVEPVRDTLPCPHVSVVLFGKRAAPAVRLIENNRVLKRLVPKCHTTLTSLVTVKTQPKKIASCLWFTRH